MAGERLAVNDNNSAHNGCVNGDSQCALTGAGAPTIGVRNVPAKVRARSAEPPVLTYPFLDSGSMFHQVGVSLSDYDIRLFL